MTGERPLAGIRVVDTADGKGELCGRLLADFGADVLRLEPEGGAPSRRRGPFAGDASLYFAVRNANKAGAAVDLTTEAGRDELLGVLAGADIWIETSRPGELAAVGLAPQAIAERFDHLIVLSLTDFGQTGPYRDFVATDAVMEAMSWMLFRAGVPELPPVLPPGNLAYDMAGISAAFAVLTAYLDRAATGAGQYIDMSVMEAVAQLTDWGLTSYSVIRKLGLYGEVRDGGGKVYPILPCADGFVRPSMVTLSEFHKLREWMGRPPELMEDIWDDQRIRIELFEEFVKPAFIEFFKDKTMTELAVDGQNRGIPITPMLTPGDVLVAEQFKALGSFAQVEVAPGVPAAVASGFYLVDGERVGFRHPAPQAGGGLPSWAPRAVAVGAGGGSPGRPYAGLRVVEFGVAGAVPEMARLLAEYGADVIRIENPHRLDLFRQLGGPSGVGSVFASSNRTTRSFAVDYTTAEGAALARRLVAGADVVLENLPPGTLDPFGLGPEQLRDVKPSLLVISSQTMGRRGPWSHWRGYGSNTQLPGGMSWLWSFPDRAEPVPQNVAFPDHVVGRLGAVAVAADLVARRQGRNPAGHVEIVQAEMALNLLADLLAQESVDPGSVRPRGNRSDQGAPWGVYQCQGNERWCVITCRDDDDWRGLVAALGAPSWAADTRFDTAEGRQAAADEIDAYLAAWTAGRADREVMELLQAHGVPAGKMMYMSDQPEDPHLRDRGYILEIDQPPLGEVLFEGPAFHATRLPDPITTPAPALGQHTREIAASSLGLDGDDVDRLVGAGVLAEPPG